MFGHELRIGVFGEEDIITTRIRKSFDITKGCTSNVYPASSIGCHVQAAVPIPCAEQFCPLFVSRCIVPLK